jgi:cobalt-zinc-cadmium resistance protein CzcA
LLCYLALRPPLPHEENAVVRACRRAYEPALRWAVRFPKYVFGMAVVALVLSVVAARGLGTEFLPELNEGTVWVNMNLPPGISVPETMALLSKARAQLATVPEVTTTVSKAGRPEDGTDPKPINMVEIFVGLKPASEWRPGVSREQLLHEMDQALAVIPGLEVSFSQPIRDNVLESISQIDGQVVIKVFGEDPEALKAAARQVLASAEKVQGVSRAFVDRAGDVPQARLDIDRAAAARYGLSISDIEEQIELALGGRSVTELWEGERHYGVVTRLAVADRQLSKLDGIEIDTPSGARIPLADVAHYSVGGGSMNISRENGRRVVAIGVFIEGRDMGSVVKDMQARVAGLTLPPATTISWSGEFENQQRAMQRLMLIIPISIFVIFVLLFNAFNSVKDTLLILLNVPFAMIGGIVALLVTGIPLSVSAAIGFIALFGQSVLNGVVMISVFNQLLEAGHSPHDAVIEGALVRMRTVLMTALLAMLGLLPMALSHGIGSETQKPLAIVIIGGLFTGTLLVLLVLPALFLAVARRQVARHAVPRTAAIAALMLPLFLTRCSLPHPQMGAGLTRSSVVAGEWVDVAKSTATDTSLWVLGANGYDGNAHLRQSPTDGTWQRSQSRYGTWYSQVDMADSTRRQICYAKRIGRNGSTCVEFSVDTLVTPVGPRTRLTLYGYQGQHHVSDRQLVERR